MQIVMMTMVSTNSKKCLGWTIRHRARWQWSTCNSLNRRLTSLASFLSEKMSPCCFRSTFGNKYPRLCDRPVLVSGPRSKSKRVQSLIASCLCCGRTLALFLIPSRRRWSRREQSAKTPLSASIPRRVFLRALLLKASRRNSALPLASPRTKAKPQNLNPPIGLSTT